MLPELVAGPLFIPIILGSGLCGLWMATGWDTQDQRLLLRLVNWLMLFGLYFDFLWIVRIITGIGFRNLAFIGIALLVVIWTILKDWNTTRAR